MNPADLLPLLARASAQAGVLALLVLAAQAVLRHRLAPRWRCALWLLVAARLALPVAPASATSLFNLLPAWGRPAVVITTPVRDATADLPRQNSLLSSDSDQAAPQPNPPSFATETPRLLAAPEPTATTHITPTDAPRQPAATESRNASNTAPSNANLAARAATDRTSAPASEANRAVALPAAPPAAPAALPAASTDWPRRLLVGWLAGFASVLAALLWSSLALARRFRHARPLRDPAVAALLDDARRRLGLRAAPPVLECAGLAGPALHGCWRPRLLLPAGLAERFSPDEMRHIFLHELAHLRRHDLPVHWLLSLLQAAHWFNPLVWLAFARWRAERELACDALALEALGAGHNAAYGRTLLRLLESFAPQSPAPGLACLLENRDHLRRRVAQIAAFVPGRRRPLPAALLLAAFALAGLTDAQVAAPTTPAPAANQAAVAPAAVLPGSVASPSSAVVASAAAAITPAVTHSTVTTAPSPTPEPAKGLRFAEPTAEQRRYITESLAQTPGVTTSNATDFVVHAAAREFRADDQWPKFLAGEGLETAVQPTRTYFYLRPKGSMTTLLAQVAEHPPKAVGGLGIPANPNQNAAESGKAFLQRVAALDQVKAGSYEARFLNYSNNNRPSILWLKSAAGGTDLFCTFSTMAAWTAPAQVSFMTTEEFRAKAQEENQRSEASRLRYPSEPIPPAIPPTSTSAASATTSLVDIKGLRYVEAPVAAIGAVDKAWNAIQRFVPQADKKAGKVFLPVYSITPDMAPTNGRFDDVTKLTHYYYPIMEEGGKAVGGVTIQVDISGSMLEQISVGSMTATILNAVQAGSFEVRLLEIARHPMPPALRFMGLWLKSLSGGTDLIYVIFSTAGSNLPSFTAGTLLTVDEFSAKFRPLASGTATQAAPTFGAAITPTGSSSTAAPPQPGQPWKNSLGMKFVPVPGTGVLFGIWDVRVQDYQAFVDATKRKWAKVSAFAQGPTDPAVYVTWDDAQAFCAWLTAKERAAGRLTTSQSYRLPQDWEWSVAAGLDEPHVGTPESKSAKIPNVYPWGAAWPPPPGAGNYGPSMKVDEFANTSPVGSFAANKFGLFDMGGNVWQWCEDFYSGNSGPRVLRGSSFRYVPPDRLLSSYRNLYDADIRFDFIGFRVVVGGSPAATSTGTPSSAPAVVPPATQVAAPASSAAVPFAKIEGQVRAPGTYQAANMFDLIILAGGYTDDADDTKVALTRTDTTGRKTLVTLAVQAPLGGQSLGNVRLEPNDRIMVPAVPDPLVSIEGQVQAPGTYQAASMVKLIIQAGGFTRSADDTKVTLTRTDNTGRQTVETLTVRIPLGGSGSGDVRLVSNDRIFVPASSGTRGVAASAASPNGASSLPYEERTRPERPGIGPSAGFSPIIPSSSDRAAPPALSPSNGSNGPVSPTDASLAFAQTALEQAAVNVNMPSQFRFAAGPQDGADRVLTFLRSQSLSARFNLDAAKVSVLPPLAQYRLPSNPIADGSELEAATADGFYYILMQDNLPVGSADLRPVASPFFRLGGTVHVAHSLQALGANPQIKPSTYEARLIFIGYPGMPANVGPQPVVWLAPINGGGGDLLYFADQSRLPNSLQAGHVYPAREFFDTILGRRNRASVSDSVRATPTIRISPARLPPVSPTDASLAFAQTALEQAAILLDGATRETRPGLVESALDDLARALYDVAAVRQMARAGSLSAYPPPAETPDEAQLRAALGLTERDGGGAQPNMYGTLTFMKLALLSLQEAPGGDLNGLRPRLTATLAQAAARIIAGIEWADALNGRGAPAPSRSAPPATSAVSQTNPPASADAASRWLDATDTALRNALGSLAGAGRPEHGGFVERATDAILDALAEARIAAATERARPAGPALSPPALSPSRGSNGSDGPNGPGYDQLLSDLSYSRPPGLRTQSNMTGTQAMLRAALLALQNAPGGDLGGARDRLTAAIGRASAALRAGIEYADTREALAPRGSNGRLSSAPRTWPDPATILPPSPRLATDPRLAASQALNVVRLVRANPDYASPATRPALLSELNVIEALARAIADDPGANPATMEKLSRDLARQLIQTRSRLLATATSPAEPPDARAESQRLADELRLILAD